MLKSLTRRPLSFSLDDLFDAVEDEFFAPVFSSIYERFHYNMPPINESISSEGAYSLEIACAGIAKEEIHVTLKDRSLTIQIDKRSANPPEGTLPNRTVITQRIANRSFKMCRELPAEYDVDKIQCSFKNGLLAIQVPLLKEPAPQCKTIEIQTA